MPLLQPPGSYADFEFTFDPQLSNLFPNPPQLPPSSELFSASEQNQLFGFLDEFAEGPLDDALPFQHQQGVPQLPPHPQEHFFTHHSPHTYPASNSSRSSESSTTPPQQFADPPKHLSKAPSRRSTPTSAAANGASRARPLLSTPQKRLNHIMSEQKRRNAIRDGYAQLISLLAPAGCAATIDMPTRGRPKGSGRGKGKGTKGTKGKSGVLFRAVEYCKWLEEGRDALMEEVRRMETLAGVQTRNERS